MTDGQLNDRSVALVHEWFGSVGGSEKVFLHLGRLMPHAKRFVLWKDSDVVDDFALHQSWMSRTPLRSSKAVALPFMPLTWRTLTKSQFDVVISSSHAFAHTVKLRDSPGTRYLSYVHTPARYVWSPSLDGRGANPFLAGPRKALQAADVRLSRHIHSYAANSLEVQARIRRFWNRDACVINPPVDIDFYGDASFSDRQQNRDYLLGVGRWIPYKNFDLMIRIAEAAKMPLVLAGGGSQESALRRLAADAGVPVVLEVRPTNERLRQLYWGARCLLFPTHEDFGIIPVEAQACGTPVIGLSRGGLLETVVDGESGYLVDSLRADNYARLIPAVDRLSRDVIQRQASRFSQAAFEANLAKWVASEC
jgi:glycosyltransferase involved in cell wall biosynthesis